MRASHLLTRDNFGNDICRYPYTTELAKFATELFLKKIPGHGPKG